MSTTTGGPPEYSLAEISGAISRATGLSAELKEISDLSGRLHSDLHNNQALRAAGLDSAAVMAYVATHLTGDLADKMDPTKREAALREQAKNANPTGAWARTAFASFGAWGNGIGKIASASGHAESGGDSRRSYTDLPGDWNTAKLQTYAEKLGVGWAANNPDLLRLGPAAIESFAKVNMHKETYEKLTKKIGFTNREAVNEVNYYLKNRGDPARHKEHVDELDRNLQDLTGGDPEAMRRAREAIARLTASKGTEADKQTFNTDIGGIAGGDAAKQEAGQALGKRMKTISDQTHAKEAKVADSKNELAALMGSGTPASQQPKPKKDEPNKTADQAKLAASEKAAGKKPPQPAAPGIK